MKRKKTEIWISIAITVIFIATVYLLLGIGIAAQRTYTFSVLKEIETTGITLTNITQQLEVTPVKNVLTMRPVVLFHKLVLVIAILWGTVLLTIMWRLSKGKPDNMSE